MKIEEQPAARSRRAFLQALSKTWFVRLASIFLLLALCVWAAEAIWEGRDLLAVIIIAALVIYVIRKSIKLFPIPKAMQAYFAEQERLSGLYPSHRYKSWLWYGIVISLHESWRYYGGYPVATLTLAILALFLSVGLVATIIWHVKHRNVRAT